MDMEKLIELLEKDVGEPMTKGERNIELLIRIIQAMEARLCAVEQRLANIKTASL